MKIGTQKRAAAVARLFKMVSSTTRAHIMIVVVSHKEISVEAIAQEMGMTHSAISHQLAILAGSDILIAKKSGRNMMYSLSKNPLAKVLGKLVATVNV